MDDDDFEVFFKVSAPSIAVATSTVASHAQQLTTIKAVRHAERAERKVIIDAEQSAINDILRLVAATSRRCASQQPPPPQPAPLRPFQVEQDIDEQLLPHQRAGVKWLAERHWKGRGCVLADEMGLGKTVQISAFLGCGMRTKVFVTAVLVVPTTLIANWISELQKWGKFAEGKDLLRIDGTKSKKDRLTLWRRLSYGSKCAIVTSYGIFKNDIEAITAHNNVDYVILDEAQSIRNPGSEVAKVAHNIRAQHRIAVTGTPIMNSFKDIWSIMQFADPAVIAQTHAQFSKTNDELMRGNERDRDVEDRRAAMEKLEALRARVAPYILHRQKKDIREMCSAKSDFVLWLQPSESQQRHYTEFLHTPEVRFGLQQVSNHHPLTLLSALKRIADHTWLNMTEANFKHAMQKFAGAGSAAPPDELASFGPIDDSAKIQAAIVLLRRHAAEGRKTLVFSQSKRLLMILSSLLRRMQLNHITIDGDMPANVRQGAVNDFNEAQVAELSACLLTTQVGGVGLTFNSATRAILLDPSWNPAVDAQAIDRIHRIGQTSDVITYRLITCGTVEEKAYRNQIHKMAAARQVMSAAANVVSGEAHGEVVPAACALRRYFTQIQLRSMFKAGAFDFSETAAQLAEVHPDDAPPTEVINTMREALPCAVSMSNHLSIFTESGVKELEEIEERRRTKMAVRNARKRGIAAPDGPSRRRKRQEVCRGGDHAVDEVPQDSQEIEALILGTAAAAAPSPQAALSDVVADMASVRLSAFHQSPADNDDSEDIREAAAAVVCFRGLRMAPLDMELVGRLTLELQSLGGSDLDDNSDEDGDDDDVDWSAFDAAGDEIADDEVAAFNTAAFGEATEASEALRCAVRLAPPSCATSAQPSPRRIEVEEEGVLSTVASPVRAVRRSHDGVIDEEKENRPSKRLSTTPGSVAAVVGQPDPQQQPQKPRSTVLSFVSSAFSAFLPRSH